MSANAPQPPPALSSSSRAVWPTIYENANLVLPAWAVADMRLRDELGRMKYGVALQTHNGRDAVVDAYQEALDLLVYTQQARLELQVATLKPGPGADWNRRLALDSAFHFALGAALRLGELVHRAPTPRDR